MKNHAWTGMPTTCRDCCQPVTRNPNYPLPKGNTANTGTSKSLGSRSLIERGGSTAILLVGAQKVDMDVKSYSSIVIKNATVRTTGKWQPATDIRQGELCE